MTQLRTSAAIYALVDPTTNAPRYVGRTVASLRVRLMGHTSEAKCSLRGRNGYVPPAKCMWITYLKASGKVPRIHLIQRVRLSIAASREAYWIWRLRSDGANLLNVFRPNADFDSRSKRLARIVPCFKSKAITS